MTPRSSPADHGTRPAPGAEAPDSVRDTAWEEAERNFVVDLRRRGYSLLTLRDYQGDVERLRAEVDAAPAELRPADVDRTLAAWAAGGMSAGILRRKRSALRGFLAFLGRSEERTLPAAEAWSRLMRLAAPDRLMVALVAAAGARLHELCALEGRDLRSRSGVVRFREGLRIVPMHPALRLVVDDARREMPLVAFRPVLPGHNGFAVNTRTMHARFRRAAIRLGAPDLRPDDLRRELAAHLTARETPQGLVAAFLARDRGRPLAPRRGGLADLTCLSERIASYPLSTDVVAAAGRGERRLFASEG